MDDTTTTASTETTTATSAPESSTFATPPPAPPSAKDAIESVLAKHSSATPGEATTQPADEGGASLAGKKGPIPFDVHKKTLDNAYSERDALSKQLEEWKAYEWAKQIPQDQFNEAMQWFGRYKGDPIDFVQNMVAELQSHPVHGQALKSLAAKALAAGRGGGGQAAEAMPAPDVAITDANGNVVGQTYSAEQLQRRDAWLTNQVLSKVEQKYQPIVDTVEKQREHEAERERQHVADTFGRSAFSELTQLPQFKEHAKEIHARLSKVRLDSDHPSEVMAAAMRIYNQVVLPKLTQTAEASKLAELKQKAVAQVETTTGTAPASIARPTNPRELAKFMAQRAAARR